MLVLNSASGVGLLPNAIDLTASLDLDADDIATVSALAGSVTIQSGTWDVTDYELSALAAGILAIEIENTSICQSCVPVQVGTVWQFQVTAGASTGTTTITITTTLGPVVITVNVTPALTTIEWTGVVEVADGEPDTAYIDLFSGITTVDGVAIEAEEPSWQLDESLLGVTLVSALDDPDDVMGAEPTVEANDGVVRLVLPYSGNGGTATITVTVIGLGVITVTFTNTPIMP